MLFKIILLSCLSGILYRLGGSDKRGNWFDLLRNTKTRDLGISLIQGGILIWLTLKSPLYGAIRGIFWRFLLTIGLTFGFLTTYWDKLTRLWRKDENEYFENYFLHGFFIGSSLLPLMGIFGFWKIILRAVLLGLGMAIWSTLIKWDILEEWGRGFLIIFSLICLYV